MEKFLLFIWWGGVLLMAMNACNKNDIGVPEEVDEKTLATNKWIKEEMQKLYFWNDKIPAIDETKESDPEAYFYKLLYEDDNFSWITDDYASVQSGYNGEPVAMGYNPAFYTFGDAPDRVFIVVNYVFPESGAYVAGLRRGNIILKINDQEITTDNYYDLYSGSAYKVELGKAQAEISGGETYLSITPSGKTLQLTSAIPDPEPAIRYKIIDTLDYKIGYLAYVEFILGKDDKYLSSLDKIFSEFKIAGISNLIVDLRYNPGGDIDAAVHLASAIAPSNVVAAKKILVNLKYNSDYQKTIERSYPEELTYKFENLSTNINLQKVYFLTTQSTASASELVITGLDPYMDVVQVGDSTYGKFYGAYVLPDDDEKWAILPVVLKYSNFEGYTDFVDGLIPDQSNLMEEELIVDNAYYNNKLIYSYPLGSPTDPMTKRAIELIAGRSSVTVTTRAASAPVAKFRRLQVNKDVDRKSNLFVPVRPEIKELLEKE